MIEALLSTPATSRSNETQSNRVLTYVKNERMGGFVPKYVRIEEAVKNEATSDFKTEMSGSQGDDILSANGFKAYRPQSDQFSFNDLVDMANPLHHIPVVGYLYREITDDQIKPASKIIGGAAFGGPLGGAVALVDTVIAQETGNGLAGNAYKMAFSDNSEESEPTLLATSDKETDPQATLENAIKSLNDAKSTSALLSYSDLGHQDEKLLKYEAMQRVEEKMKAKVTAPIIDREPITELNFAQKGGLYSF